MPGSRTCWRISDPAFAAVIPVACGSSLLRRASQPKRVQSPPEVTISSVLNQTCAIFTLILATVFLGEKLTGRRVVAIALGFGGAALVSLHKVLEGAR